MFMKLNDINEAQYTSHERGSLHWMLDKFFVGPNKDNEYWLDDNRFIALYHGREIIGVKLEAKTVVMIPNLGGRASGFTAHHKKENMPQHLKIYSSKRLV